MTSSGISILLRVGSVTVESRSVGVVGRGTKETEVLPKGGWNRGKTLVSLDRFRFEINTVR